MARATVPLEEHLKALRLLTFLREYDKLARECDADGVDYPLWLSELELLDREEARRATGQRIKAAKCSITGSTRRSRFPALPKLNTRSWCWSRLAASSSTAARTCSRSANSSTGKSTWRWR